MLTPWHYWVEVPLETLHPLLRAWWQMYHICIHCQLPLYSSGCKNPTLWRVEVSLEVDPSSPDGACVVKINGPADLTTFRTINRGMRLFRMPGCPSDIRMVSHAHGRPDRSSVDGSKGFELSCRANLWITHRVVRAARTIHIMVRPCRPRAIRELGGFCPRTIPATGWSTR